MPTSQATQVVQYFRDQIVASSIGVWNAGESYSANETGVSLNELPKMPDRMIVLAMYMAPDDNPNPRLKDRRVRVQVMVRGTQSRANCRDILESISDVLSNQHYRDTGYGFKISRIQRLGGGELAPDSNSRWLASDNYEITYQRLGQ